MGAEVGKLNWTDLTGLFGPARDFTVSMTFRHLNTVVEMVDWLLFAGLDVAGVDGGGDTAAVVEGCKGIEELRGGAAGGWPIKGKTA